MHRGLFNLAYARYGTTGEETSRQCNFSIVGGSITGTYRFKKGFYGLGDMPNEFQRVMDQNQEPHIIIGKCRGI